MLNYAKFFKSISIKILIVFLIVTGTFFVEVACKANCQFPDKKYEVSYIKVDLDVYENGYIIVTENIAIHYIKGDFTYFYRTIPIQGMEYLEVLSVNAENVTVTDRSVKYDVSEVNIYVHYKKIYAPASVIFTIKYKVYGAIFLASQTQNKIEWNAVGLEWKVPIGYVNVTVRIPGNFIGNDLFSLSPAPDKVYYLNGYTVSIFSHRNLPPHVGYRIVIVFPKIYEPPPDYLSIPKKHPVEVALLIPILSSAIMLGLWFFRGRIPKVDINENKILLGVPPSDLTPAETAFLLNRHLKGSNILGIIVDLARRGFITLEYEKNLLSFKPSEKTLNALNGRYDRELKPFEIETLRLAISSKNSINLGRKVEEIRRIERMVEAELVRNGYFKSSPRNYSFKYIYTGIIVMGLGFLVVFLLMGIFESNPSNMFFVKGLYPIFFGIGLSSFPIIFIGSYLFTNYTLKGAREYRAWKIYLNKLSSMNNEHVKRFSNPKDVFDRNLPFIVSFMPFYFYSWAMLWGGNINYMPSWFNIQSSIQVDFASFIKDFSEAINTALVGLPTRISAVGGGLFGFGGGGGGGGSGGGGGGVG